MLKSPRLRLWPAAALMLAAIALVATSLWAGDARGEEPEKLPPPDVLLRALSALEAGVVNQAVVILPAPDLNSLNQTPVPEPPNLVQFVKNKPAAVRLGKALFWDMQVGSDGIQACASCHFSAGADNRLKNTVNPGTKAGDTTFQVVGPNGTLQPADFPFHQRAEPAESPSSPVIRTSNDVVGSQGVRLSEFVDIVPGSAVDRVSTVLDPVFNVGGANTRGVTARNTPTVINAIFNFTNFWDGRASFIFNGENPFGLADEDAGVWFNDPALGLMKRPVAIEFASVASQTTGPPLDPTEMSARGRTFPQLGRKMLSLTPLGRQLVHPGDGVLGNLSRAVEQPNGKLSGNGLDTTYGKMIQDAFQSYLWNSSQPVTVTLSGGQPAEFTQMEANFSLFWGLSIQLYLATLVSDQTPFDRWLAGDNDALTDQQKFGFAIFSSELGKCSACHGGIEFTNASATAAGFLNNTDHNLIELMFTSDGTQTIYDDGFNNTAITPIGDDAGRGGAAPFTNRLTAQPYPLSYSARAVLQDRGLLPFLSPILDPFIRSSLGSDVNMPVNANGAFKVPGLRNVELTGPYFHNGSVSSLEDVVDLYIRGGNFPADNLHELDPLVGQGLPLLVGNQGAISALVEFMKSLTDPRVRAESVPFDHPEILVPNGDPEILIRIPAKDANGFAAPAPALALNPVNTLIRTDSQTIYGSVEAGLTPVVTVNTSATIGPVAVTGTDWSVRIDGLAEGDNVVTVSVVDSSSVQTTLNATITFVLPIISGKVTDQNGAPLPGVTLALAGGATGTVVTDASGNYALTELLAGSYTLTPSLPGVLFTPSSMSVTIGSDDLRNYHFVGRQSELTGHRLFLPFLWKGFAGGQ